MARAHGRRDGAIRCGAEQQPGRNEQTVQYVLEKYPHSSCRELVAMTTTSPRRGELFPQRRDRSIADLATEIAATEASRARWLRVVEALTEAGRQSRREQAMVGLAERKLQLLHSSYDTLAPRQSPDG